MATAANFSARRLRAASRRNCARNAEKACRKLTNVPALAHAPSTPFLGWKISTILSSFSPPSLLSPPPHHLPLPQVFFNHNVLHKRPFPLSVENCKCWNCEMTDIEKATFFSKWKKGRIWRVDGRRKKLQGLESFVWILLSEGGIYDFGRQVWNE